MHTAAAGAAATGSTPRFRSPLHSELSPEPRVLPRESCIDERRARIRRAPPAASLRESAKIAACIQRHGLAAHFAIVADGGV